MCNIAELSCFLQWIIFVVVVGEGGKHPYPTANSWGLTAADPCPPSPNSQTWAYMQTHTQSCGRGGRHLNLAWPFFMGMGMWQNSPIRLSHGPFTSPMKLLRWHIYTELLVAVSPTFTKGLSEGSSKRKTNPKDEEWNQILMTSFESQQRQIFAETSATPILSNYVSQHISVLFKPVWFRFLSLATERVLTNTSGFPNNQFDQPSISVFGI